VSEYESPVKQQLRDALAKLGNFATPALRESVEKAIAGIDDTDPAPVARKLPPQVLAFYEACALPGQDLALHSLRAREQGFHIETIGVVTGEISMEEIAEQSHKVHWAAVGALDRMKGWFSNPRPLIRTLNFGAAAAVLRRL
jgi:hypothetical protein